MTSRTATSCTGFWWLHSSETANASAPFARSASTSRRICRGSASSTTRPRWSIRSAISPMRCRGTIWSGLLVALRCRRSLRLRPATRPRARMMRISSAKPRVASSPTTAPPVQVNMTFVVWVVAWENRTVSASNDSVDRPSCSAVSRKPSNRPSARSAGVVAALLTNSWPDSVSTTHTSVNVPPTSTPTTYGIACTSRGSRPAGGVATAADNHCEIVCAKASVADNWSQPILRSVNMPSTGTGAREEAVTTRGRRQPTLKSIAAAAGVHPSTVSRTLNGRPDARVPEETLARIRKVAADLGYEPNPWARSLRTQRTMMLGLVIPRLTDVVLARMFEGAEEHARGLGYQTITVSTSDREALERDLVNSLIDRRVDGLVLATPTLGDPALAQLDDEDFPFVLLNRASGDHPAVRGDDELGGYLATRHLLEMGHRRIAHIGGPQSTSTAKLRLQIGRAHV